MFRNCGGNKFDSSVMLHELVCNKPRFIWPFTEERRKRILGIFDTYCKLDRHGPVVQS